MQGKPFLIQLLFVLSVGVSWEWHSHRPPRSSGCLHFPTTFVLCQARPNEHHRGWNWLYILWDSSAVSSTWGLSLQPHHWIFSDRSLSWRSELLWSARSCYNLFSIGTPSMYVCWFVSTKLFVESESTFLIQNLNPRCASWNFSAAGKSYLNLI